MIDSQLAGRVALVTGANHGIGAAIAKALAEQGARVFATYLRAQHSDDPALPSEYYEVRMRDAGWLVDEINASGGTAAASERDLSDSATIPLLFDEIEVALGPVEIVVNNAAHWEGDSFLGVGRGEDTGLARQPMTAERHDAHFAVNSRAVALIIAEFARRHMRRGADWGRIVSITSAGRDGFPHEASYGASKAALESYTFTAAWELGRFGVTANVINPSAVDTGWISPELAERVRNRSPFAHVMMPEEIAEAVVFLASHQARFITGQTLAFR
jgi:3-oxoacyl-[acyl-carrier protein] reductase